MAQQLREYITLPEGQSSIPSTHMVQLTTIFNSSSKHPLLDCKGTAHNFVPPSQKRKFIMNKNQSIFVLFFKAGFLCVTVPAVLEFTL